MTYLCCGIITRASEHDLFLVVTYLIIYYFLAYLIHKCEQRLYVCTFAYTNATVVQYDFKMCIMFY